MSHLVVPKIECIESEDKFGRFIAEPLEKGFGVTLGNALRRVLLGHLQGAAVTHVRIDGIHHEFSTIPDVKEDTTEFLLNVKALRLRPLSEQLGKLILDVKGEGRITAADISPSSDFEIANPELYLVTLDSPEAKLYVEFDVELSKGYQEAKASDNLIVGVIPVDAIFTPTRKVNFTVEPVHVGQEASLERLCLEVWTDDTITPADAVSRSAELLVEQLTPFANFTRISEVEEASEASRLSIPEELYNMTVEQMNLSVRTLNCLRRGGIATVGELIGKEERELMTLRNFGQKSRREIDERLEGLGLSLVKKGDEAEGGLDEDEETDD
ncbi:DNA-directed RNA polymerase subunit alpha [Chloroflexota bacterium]